MAVQLLCPNLRCRRVLAVPEEVRGKLVKCQHCQTMFRVPEARILCSERPDKDKKVEAA